MILFGGHTIDVWKHISNENGIVYSKLYSNIDCRIHPLLSDDTMFADTIDIADRSNLLMLNMDYSLINLNYIIVWKNAIANIEKVWLVNKTPVRVFVVLNNVDLSHIKCRIAALDVWPSEINIT